MKIHLVGVGGVAMGNLAAMLKEQGHEVTGSDRDLYPPMSDRLREWGIEAGAFSGENVGRSDLYIIGNAISRGNPEVEKILNENLPYMSMATALSEFFLKGKEVIVVAGTHGKTTTTFLMDHILSVAHRPPGLFAGGVRADGMSGFRVSDSPYFVIEGDEYDTAFFDKHSKFIHYRPRYLILTSVEFDHADIFDDYKDYLRSFRRLLRLVPSEGLVVACADDAGVREAMDGFQFAPVEWYGSKTHSKKGKKVESIHSFTREGLHVRMEYPGEIPDFSLIGSHNTLNALAASLVAQRIGLSPERVAEAMRTFPGVLRRQQIRARIEKNRWNGNPILLMEDFAHHPTAVRATIEAVREAYPGFAVHALFEPRSATSHRNLFQKRYAKELGRADRVYLCEIFNREKVAAPERLNVKKIVSDLRGKKDQKEMATYGADPADLLSKFQKKFHPIGKKGDLILVMSNGAFGGIYPSLDRFVEESQA